MENNIVTLADISIGNAGSYGIAASAVDFSENLPTYLRITDINDDGTLNKSSLKSVDDSNSYKYKLKPNDIVFARTGASTGRNYFYDGSDGDFVYAGFLIKFSIDPLKAYPKYVKYICLSKKYRNWVQSQMTGSTRGNMNAQQFGKLPIELPPLDTQRKIASILSAIDDKIELNNQMNENLMEQAQSIYKNWFIDFALFGGVMPNNWKIGSIYDISDVIYGAPFASKLFNTNMTGKPVIRIRDLKNQEFITYTTENHPKGYLLQKGDIVVGMDGEFKPYIWGNDEAWLNQRVCVFSNKRQKGKFYLLFTLKPQLDFIEKTEAATTVIHIGKNDFDKFTALIPDEETMNKFDEVTTFMYESIINNMLENKRLAELRDTLLPKLMSGEIDVENIEL